MLDQIPLLNELPPGWRELVARLLLIVFVLILTLILRRVLTMIIIRPLRRLATMNNHDRDDEILKVIMLPIRYMVLAFAISAGVEILGVGDSIDRFISNVASTLFIVAILLLIYRMIDVLAPSSRRLAFFTGIEIEERLLPFMRTAAKLVIIAIGLVIILQDWGYDVSGLVAGFGLGGLAFSLAAQDTVSNLFGFASIVADSPFDVGEYIKTPDVEGVVEHVGLRSTRVRQLDQAVVYVPNSKLAGSPILNWSRLSKRRIDYTLGVTYDSTSGELRVLLHRIREYFKSQPTIDPETVVVYFVEFGASSLDILIRSYVMLPDWAEFTAEKERLHLAVLDIVNELGMSIAFPSTSLYVETLPPIMNEQEPTDKKPSLSPRERALMQGRIHEKPKAPPTSEEENITGQQDG